MLIPQENIDKNRIVNVKQINKTKAFIKGYRKRKGMKFWMLDMTTGEITIAKFNSVTAGYKAGVQNRIDAQAGMLYVQAVNKLNAERKFIPMVKRVIEQGAVLQYLDNEK